MEKLINKVAVVTGAAQGISASIVERLFADGATVVCLDVNMDKLKESILKIDKTGERAISLKCDVSNQEEVNQVFDQIYEKLGKVDILVNNAGIVRDAFFHKMTPEQWHAVINVNLNSMFYTC